MLNQNLETLAQWLCDHKLTLNISKSKFVLIGSSKKLSSLDLSLKIMDKDQERVDSYKYLGVIINETLSWSDPGQITSSMFKTKCPRGWVYLEE